MNRILYLGNTNELPVAQYQKAFNIFSRLVHPEGAIDVLLYEKSIDKEFIKKISKFAGLVLDIENDNLLKFKKKIYQTQKITGVAQQQPVVKKDNPFLKAKNEVVTGLQQNTINEDNLLTNDTIEDKLVSDCSTKPRACKNCSCGRKEVEDGMDEEELARIIATGQVKSECGSCYLGDAFRCASCPYRGKFFQPKILS